MKITKVVIVLLLGTLLSAYSAYAKLPQNITTTFPSAIITPGHILLKAPDVAENGAVVSITIEQVLLQGGEVYVKEIWMFDHFRNIPIAHYKLGPNAIPAGMTSRYKLLGTSLVYAVALLSDGSMVSGEKLIRVTIGGCGNGGSTVSGQHYVPPANLPPPAFNYPNSAVQRHSALSWQETEKYTELKSNGIVRTEAQPVSTFSVDVDTGSYSNVRRFLLKQGRLPMADAVRVEEMINYFSYRYPLPESREEPFTVTTEVGPAPWSQGKHLLQIGIQGYREDRAEIPPMNLVFLVDVSGSMLSHDKLGLVKSSLRLLAQQMSERDRIAIVVYAGASGVVLDTTRGDDRESIIDAIDRLTAGGSTNGGAGIRLAYSMARKSFIQNGVNRVILATDGDFNVGTVNHNELIDLIRAQRKSGVSLTTLGFGTGNYNERLMEQLADHGDGNYAYIDSLREARKVLITQMTGTLFTIAKDVKVQVEFNPAVVAEYRLIGYENRLLRREDFKNDKVDAGDVGAGHTVTALYEIALTGSAGQSVEPLRYAKEKPKTANQDEIAFVRMRYKGPQGGESREMKQAVSRNSIQSELGGMSENYRFATAVAAFGQLLRDPDYMQHMNFDQVYRLASNALGDDGDGHRREFLDLIDAAGSLRR